MKYIKKFSLILLCIAISLISIAFLPPKGKNKVNAYTQNGQIFICKDNNGYVPTSSPWELNNFPMGYLIINGASRQSGNVYGRKPNQQVTIQFAKNYKHGDLLPNPYKGNHRLCNDSAKVGGWKVGTGLIHIEWTNADGTKGSYWSSNVFSNIDTLNLLGSNEIGFNESNITIKVYYECVRNGWGFLSLGAEYYNAILEFHLQLRNDTTTVYAVATQEIEVDTSEIEDSTSGDITPEIEKITKINPHIADNSVISGGFSLDFAGNKYYTVTVDKLIKDKTSTATNFQRTTDDPLYGKEEFVRDFGYPKLAKNGDVFESNGKYTITTTNIFGNQSVQKIIIDDNVPLLHFNNFFYNGVFSGYTKATADFINNTAPLKIETLYYAPGEEIPEVITEPFETLQRAGYYVFSISNQLYKTTYQFELQDFIYPSLNYNNAYAFNQLNYKTVFYTVETIEDEIYGFNSQNEAYTFAFNYEYENFVTEQDIYQDGILFKTYLYKGESYNNNAEVTEEINAGISIKLKFLDIEKDEILNLSKTLSTGKAYLNGFMFIQPEHNGVVETNKVYYKKIDSSFNLNSYNSDTFQNEKNLFGKFEYGILVSEQLSSQGRYLIVEENIYQHCKIYDAYYITDINLTTTIDYITEGATRNEVLTGDLTVDSFKIGALFDPYDDWSILKVEFMGNTDYYSQSHLRDIVYTEQGEYNLTLYNRYLHSKTFTITVERATEEYLIIENAQNLSISESEARIYLKQSAEISGYVNGKSVVITKSYDFIKEQYYILLSQNDNDTHYSLTLAFSDRSFKLNIIIAGTNHQDNTEPYYFIDDITLQFIEIISGGDR